MTEAFTADPLDVVDRCLDPRDFEIVSFIVAGLSYGRVEQIQRSARALLERLNGASLCGPSGEGLAQALPTTSAASLRPALRGWSHRLNTARDLEALLLRLGQVLRAHGSLCRLYQRSFTDEAKTQLARFCTELQGPLPPEKKGRAWKGTGLSWFASSPESGSTCKRLLMWLRWMIRQDAIDPGTWIALADPTLPLPDPRRLFVPVDTHIFRWARREGVLRTQSPTWRSVEQVTAHFRKLSPADPLRLDFEICHQEMARFRNRAQK